MRINSQTHIVLIHGAYGSPTENWFPWLSKKLMDEGYSVSLPKLPTPEGQNLPNWLSSFKEQVGCIEKNMVLVGHSLAPGFILNLLEESNSNVIGTFLIAGFLGKLGLEDFDPINESFVSKDFDWEKIKKNAGETHVYNSDNDPYVPLAKGKELAKKLEVKVNIIHNGGHVNSGSGYDQIPFLYDDIKTLLNREL